ncbi:MAG TPA: NUDIX domain-containing protein [Thermoleophilaceae bacterium]|jgi:8-oxo-dGTP pyrophosphatase MutT (NUDIX family)
MEFDPARFTGEQLNTGEEVTPARKAASVIVLREGTDGPEVLLVQRNPASRFMGGAWVFPGGAVHSEDDSAAETARRELEEEAALALDTSSLVPFSRWITPKEGMVRFDTSFFVTGVPAGADPRCDGEECVDVRWLRPRDALDAFAREEMVLVFPTIKHLEQLAEFDSVDHAVDTARGREVEPVMPRIVVSDEHRAQIFLPGEPGYEDDAG